MSFSSTAVGGAKEDLIVDIPATDSPGASANATAETDLTGTTGSTVFWVEIDCRNNPNENGVFRIYSKSSATTVGTDDSEITLRGVRGKRTVYNFPVGIIIPSNINAAYVKGDGATANSDDPTGTVKIKLGLKV